MKQSACRRSKLEASLKSIDAAVANAAMILFLNDRCVAPPIANTPCPHSVLRPGGVCN